MFAEDVELLPKGAFLGLLQTHRDDPATLQQMLRILWADMDRGGFSAALAKPVLHFNGKLFKGAGEDGYSLRLTPRRSICSSKPPAPTGARWSPPSSAPCSNAPSTPPSATPWARTTRPAPMSSAWCCPR